MKIKSHLNAEGRVGVNTEVFGGTRLGDSLFQASTLDFQSINFKDNSQGTKAAMFMNPTGTVLTVKGFDDSIMVTDFTSIAAVQGTEDTESTIANTIEHTNGHLWINDQGVQDYPGASTPVAAAHFQVLQNRGGAVRKPYWFGFYDGTIYDTIYEVDATTGAVTFNKVTKGVDGVADEDFVTKRQLDVVSGGGNFVTLDTTETITGFKTFTNSTVFQGNVFGNTTNLTNFSRISGEFLDVIGGAGTWRAEANTSGANLQISKSAGTGAGNELFIFQGDGTLDSDNNVLRKKDIGFTSTVETMATTVSGDVPDSGIGATTSVTVKEFSDRYEFTHRFTTVFSNITAGDVKTFRIQLIHGKTLEAIGTPGMCFGNVTNGYYDANCGTSGSALIIHGRIYFEANAVSSSSNIQFKITAYKA